MDVFLSSNKIFHDISLELGWTWEVVKDRIRKEQIKIDWM